MAENLKDLFEGMGISVDEDSYYDSEDGLATNMSVENGQNNVRKIKLGWGLNYHVVMPVWLSLPFNPITLEMLKKGKSISSYKLGKTAAEILHVIGEAAASDKEYREKLEAIVGLEDFLYEKKIKTKANDVFDFSVSEDGDCSPLLGELYSKYFNFYIYTGQTQRFNLGVERTVNRAALLRAKPNGSPDFDNADPRISMAYSCESTLLYEELKRTEDELKEAGKTKASIEDAKTSLRKQRIMTRPTESAFAYCYSFPVNSSHEFTKDESDKYNDPGYKLSYAQAYFRILGTDIPKIILYARQTGITNVNFVEFVRAYPASEGDNPQLGLCAQKVSTVVVFPKELIRKKIPKICTLVNDFLKEEENLDPEEIKKYIRELEPIAVDEALAAIANNISQYKFALSNPNIVEKNRQFLSMCDQQGGLALVSKLADDNKTVIDVDEVAIGEMATVVDEDEYFTSDEEDLASTITADSFMPQQDAV